MNKIKVYDCFSFFNELDLLSIRLNTLNSVVDYFVLCEASVTHSGKPKPFYFEENKHMFTEFLDKIIHVKVTDMPDVFYPLPFIEGIINPELAFDSVMLNSIYSFIEKTKLFNKETETYYGRDFFQKECVKRGLSGAADDDIVIFSDLDEIPNPIVLQEMLAGGYDQDQIYTFKQNSYYYYLNMLQSDDWMGPFMGTWGKLRYYSFNELRAQKHTIIPNGGWHFSFQGGAERVKHKIDSYSHQELNTDAIKSAIDEKIGQGMDPYGRSALTWVPLDDSFPAYVLKYKEQFAYLIKE